LNFFVARLVDFAQNRNLIVVLGGFIGRACVRTRCFTVGSLRFGQCRTETRERFFHSFLPILPAESLMRGGVPLDGFVVVDGALFDGGQFERNHCVARLGVKLGEFRRGFGSVLHLADAGLNLPPVSHVAGLYQSNQLISQLAAAVELVSPDYLQLR